MLDNEQSSDNPASEAAEPRYEPPKERTLTLVNPEAGDGEALEASTEASTDTQSEADPDGDALEALASEDGDTGDRVPDFVEVEWEGKTFKVPPEAKDALMRQADHTRTTQDVAEQRKALERQQEQFKQTAEFQQKFFNEASDIRAIDQELAQLAAVNLQQLSYDDPQQMHRVVARKQELMDKRTQTVQAMQKIQATAQEQARQQMAQMKAEGLETLKRDIPDWSPAKATKIREYGVSQGFSDQELATTVDARAIKVLDKARRYDDLMAKAQARKKPAAEAEPVPVTKGRSTVRRNPEKMSTEEWMAWRNKDLAAKGKH